MYMGEPSGSYAVCVDFSTHLGIRVVLRIELEATNVTKIVGQPLD